MSTRSAGASGHYRVYVRLPLWHRTGGTRDRWVPDRMTWKTTLARYCTERQARALVRRAQRSGLLNLTAAYEREP